MLVILRENVENLGRIGDIVKVTDGYARNFLLPRNLVVAAERSNVARSSTTRSCSRRSASLSAPTPKSSPRSSPTSP